MTFADTRYAFAEQLLLDTDYAVFAFPPADPQALSIVLEPDDPYIQAVNHQVSLSAWMRLRVRIDVGLFDNAGNLGQLEQIASTVRQRLFDITQNVGDLSAPQVMSLDTGDLLTAYFPVEILTEWSTQ